MDILKKILFYLSVPKCVACKEPLSIDDLAFCNKCEKRFSDKMLLKCSNCLNAHSECICSNDLLDKAHIHKLYKLAKYGGVDKNTPVNPLVFSLKKDNRRDVVQFITQKLVPIIEKEIKDKANTVIVNVPRMKLSVIKYGYDHSKQVAEALAKHFGIEYMPVLISGNKSTQKSKHGEERLKNTNFSIKEVDLTGKTAIIFDDIVTTGASMSACARLLREKGAKRVIGCVVAYAFRDSKAEKRKYRMQNR